MPWSLATHVPVGIYAMVPGYSCPCMHKEMPITQQDMPHGHRESIGAIQKSVLAYPDITHTGTHRLQE
jgi:hypothetical protein